MLGKLGSEFSILREASLREMERAGGYLAGEALRRLRAGEVRKEGGYDGEYGVIRLFAPGERETLLGQTTLLTAAAFPGIGEDASPTEENGPFAAVSVRSDAESGGAANRSGSPTMALNPDQEAAVQADAPIVAVIAGPGAGKTGTLVRRIAYWIEERGVPARDITAVTFTRQAAREMRERLEKQLGKRKLQGLTVGTFHAVCLGLIDKKPLISREAALDIATGLLRERKETLPPGQALALISAAKNGRSATGLPVGLLDQYNERLRALGARDLDDVLLEALNIPVTGKRMFRHLLVDEFQDLSGVQRALVKLWSQGNRLFAIGDPDQSIYGFRGADAGGFDDLLAGETQALRVRLSRNYRSTPEVLACALSVIRQNPGPERTLLPESGPGQPVRLVRAGDPLSQGIWIAKEIARLTGGVDMLEAQDSGAERPRRAFSEIAVLCRTRRQLEQLERCLRHDSIPCEIVGREDFLASEKVQAVLGFFEAMTEPGSLPALHRALKGLWRCPDGLIQRAEAAMALPGAPACPEFLSALSPFDALSPFVDTAAALLPKIKKEKPLRLARELAERAGVTGPEIEKLLNTTVFYGDMPQFLETVNLGEEGDIYRLSGGKPSGAVRLMTLHGAKGLEFPVVILAGLDKGVLPLERKDEPTDVEEERRLLFVGITRAREELILTCGGEPSPFVDELPPEVRTETLPVRPRNEGRQMSFLDGL